MLRARCHCQRGLNSGKAKCPDVEAIDPQGEKSAQAFGDALVRYPLAASVLPAPIDGAQLTPARFVEPRHGGHRVGVDREQAPIAERRRLAIDEVEHPAADHADRRVGAGARVDALPGRIDRAELQRQRAGRRLDVDRGGWRDEARLLRRQLRAAVALRQIEGRQQILDRGIIGGRRAVDAEVPAGRGRRR